MYFQFNCLTLRILLKQENTVNHMKREIHILYNKNSIRKKSILEIHSIFSLITIVQFLWTQIIPEIVQCVSDIKKKR